MLWPLWISRRGRSADDGNALHLARSPAWERLVKDLPGDVLEKITSRVVPLSEALQAAEDMLAGNLQGRVLVSVN